jgi:hypothetical protein
VVLQDGNTLGDAVVTDMTCRAGDKTFDVILVTTAKRTVKKMVPPPTLLRRP